MSFGWGGGDVVAAVQFLLQLGIAYKDAPSDYKDIAEEVRSLQTVIENAEQHIKTLSEDDKKAGQRVQSNFSISIGSGPGLLMLLV